MNALEKAMAEINKKAKKPLIRKGTSSIYVEKIPFSSPRLNYMTYGGIPVGKATEFFGGENAGKTTVALDIVKQAQLLSKRQWEEASQEAVDNLARLHNRGGKVPKKETDEAEAAIKKLAEDGPRKVLYIDAENTLDEEWARKIGVDTDELLLMRPDDETAEEVLQNMLNLIDTGGVLLMVLDSVPMLVPQSVYDEEISKQNYGGIAGAMSRFCGKVTSKLTNGRTALLMINQPRDDMQNPFNQYKTPGGRALKHLYSLRLFFRKGALLDENNEEQKQAFETPSGNLIDCVLVKTKVCKPDRKNGQVTLRYDIGFDVIHDTILMAIMYKMIQQSSSWFQIVDPSTGEILCDENGKEFNFQGRTNLCAFLKEDEVIFGELYEAVNEKLKESA